MTTKEIFEFIIAKPKWYAGIESKKGKYHNAQSANRIKFRFRNGTLSDTQIEKILNKHDYFKNEVSWFFKPNLK